MDGFFVLSGENSYHYYRLHMLIGGGFVENISRVLRELLWGWPVLAGILLAGIHLSIRTGFLPFTHCIFWLKNTLGSCFLKKSAGEAQKIGRISPVQALLTALAGSIGTGNIVGVATALTIGGPGAIFWMWVSAGIGMTTIWAETVLAVSYRVKGPNGVVSGGPMIYLERGAGKKGLAKLYAAACVLASLGMGNMAQSNAIAGALEEGFSLPPVLTGVCAAVLLFLISAGGMKSAAKVSEKLVPVMAVGYVAACVAVLLLFPQKILPAFQLIVSQAFSTQAAVGGVGGTVMLRAMECGVSRGIFTNEAGLGCSVMAYGESGGAEPGKQGCWGILQVFIDTILMCTLSALAILVSGALSTGKDGAALSTVCFSSVFGSWGKGFVCISITLFAFATMIAWSAYGQKALEYLAGNRFRSSYRVLFAAAAVLGCQLGLDAVWNLCDSFNGLMAIPNVAALFLLSGEVMREKQRCFPKNREKMRRTGDNWTGI